MLDALIRFSLKNRLVVVAAAALLIVYGARAIPALPVDVFPDLNRPTVTVMTEAEGLAPEEVEALLTLPLETALNGAPGVKRIRSSSAVGLSIVYVEFDWDAEPYLARQIVAERLQSARERLPAAAEPQMAPVSSIMGEIMLLGLQPTTATVSPLDLRTLADWDVRLRLLTIPGVAQVTVMGGGMQQIQVLADPLRMAARGIGLEELEKALANSQGNATGGFVETASQEYLVRILGQSADPEQIGNAVVVWRGDAPVRVRDIARVTLGARVKRGDGSIDGRPAVVMAISKQPSASTIQVTRAIEAMLADLQTTLPAGIRTVQLFKQSTFIEAAIDNVELALRDGAILVAIVLFLFLLNFRTTAITLTAIPLSFVLTAAVFRWFDMSINTMTLGGLAIAIGELVDDAIVDVENVFRRLRENRQAARPLPVLDVVFSASSEVRHSIVLATVLVVLVFLPLFAMTGIEGKLFAPLGIAYVVSISASLLVSLTVTPVLCSYLLPQGKALDSREYGSRLARRLQAAERRLLDWTLARPQQVILAALALVAAALASMPWLGREFLPEFNEGTATVNLILTPGTSLAESNRVGGIAEQMLLNIPEVISVGRRTGRAELDEHAEGVHFSELDVDIRPSERSRRDILADIRTHLAKLPGVAVNVGQPISHRLDHMLSGVRAQVAIKIFGDDLGKLRVLAQDTAAVISEIPGVADLQVEKQVLIPQVRIRIDRDKATHYGIAVGALAESLETALHGRVVAEIPTGQRTIEVFLRYDDPFRDSAAALAAMTIDVRKGLKLPLATFAEVVETYGPNAVQRENGRRRIVVSLNVEGRDLAGVVADVRAAVAHGVALPAGYSLAYGGQFESQATATRTIAVLSLLALAGMVLVLYGHFRSGMIAAQILFNIPLALIGSVTALWLSGGVMSIASMVGFVTLTGIVSRNTIMMIAHYLHLMKFEGETWGKSMIVRGTVERLIPVLMTALTAALALLPLVLAKDQPGKEILYPVAVVILGGLVSSTILDVIVTPALFYRYGKTAALRWLNR